MIQRSILALLCLGVIPACGDGGSSDSGIPSIPIPPGPGPATILSDDWASGTPSANWVIVDGPATVDTGVGAPSSSMKVGSSTDSGKVRSYYQFNVGNLLGGITIQMDAAYLSEIPSIDVYDMNQLPPSGTSVASAMLFDDGVVYKIGGTLYQQNVVNDGNWHRFSLKIGGGTATWKRDNVTQLTATIAVDWSIIYISGGFNTAVWIDNVLVTAP